MIDQLLMPAMIITAIAGGIVVLAHAAGAFLYDVREAKRLRLRRLHPHKRAYRERPLVTVLISAHNDASSIERCLDSIFKNNYRKVEVLVVDHASQDATAQIVRRYAATHPNHIRLVARRNQVGKSAADQQAFRCHGNGQFVLTLPANSYLDNEALARASRHFAGQPDLDMLKPGEQIIPAPAITRLLETYRALLAKRINKFLSTAGLDVSQGGAACYRANAFKQRNRAGEQLQTHYAHDVIVNMPAQSSYAELFVHSYSERVRHLQLAAVLLGSRRSLDLLRPRTWLRAGYMFCSAIISVTGPLLVAYFLYLALSLHEPTLLLCIMVGLSAFLLFSIWEAEQLKPHQKATYAFGIPMVYGLFYLLSVSHLLAVFGAAIPTRAPAFRNR
ncbi:MAG TPA: glycosyltransferase family 2 protein [Candidatus Saccharimonadales bacterium]|jgi:glycosyltransferase involved in cell wall biosynthesis